MPSDEARKGESTEATSASGSSSTSVMPPAAALEGPAPRVDLGGAVPVAKGIAAGCAGTCVQ
jgi:hypothetical protein